MRIVSNRLSLARAYLREKRSLMRAAAKTAPAAAKTTDAIVAIVTLLQSWDAKRMTPWADAVAVMAWRQRWRFEPGERNSDLGALRVLVRYLTGVTPKRCSQIAQLVDCLRDRPVKAIPTLIKEAGGIDALSFRGAELPKIKVRVGMKQKACRILNAGSR